MLFAVKEVVVRQDLATSFYKLQRTQTLKEFKDYLLEAYGITTPSISFREMIGCFLRICKENYAERYPLIYRSCPSSSLTLMFRNYLR